MYQVILTERAVKDIERLEKGIKRRIGEKIREYAEDPLHYARKLVNSAIGEYRFRIGDYRAIFDIDDDRIVILRVGHRREIYR